MSVLIAKTCNRPVEWWYSTSEKLHTVKYGKRVETFTSGTDAAHAFGEAITHDAQCNRAFNEPYSPAKPPVPVDVDKEAMDINLPFTIDMDEDVEPVSTKQKGNSYTIGDQEYVFGHSWNAQNKPRVKVKMVCMGCGGQTVLIDAWANWDTEKQELVLHSTFDDSHCEKCGNEPGIELVPLEEGDLT